MNSALELVSTKDWTRQQWLDYRANGIGGSEISSLLGLNPYKSKLRLWMEKTGQADQIKVLNNDIIRGLVSEDLAANLWQYLDADNKNETFIANYDHERTVRKCRKVHGYLINPEYPWLFCSPDRIINKGQFRLDDGSTNQEEGVLEIKCPRHFAKNTVEKESNYIQVYMPQVQLYLGVLGLEYGELLLYSDGFLDCYPIPASPEMFEYIVHESFEFWQSVERARALIKLQALDYSEERQAELQSLEPEVDDSKDVEDLLKAKDYDETSVVGDRDIHSVCIQYQQTDQKIKESEKEKQLYRNKIIQFLDRNGGDNISFGDYGYCSYRANAKGVRNLRSNVKEME